MQIIAVGRPADCEPVLQALQALLQAGVVDLPTTQSLGTLQPPMRVPDPVVSRCIELCGSSSVFVTVRDVLKANSSNLQSHFALVSMFRMGLHCDRALPHIMVLLKHGVVEPSFLGDALFCMQVEWSLSRYSLAKEMCLWASDEGAVLRVWSLLREETTKTLKLKQAPPVTPHQVPPSPVALWVTPQALFFPFTGAVVKKVAKVHIKTLLPPVEPTLKPAAHHRAGKAHIGASHLFSRQGDAAGIISRDFGTTALGRALVGPVTELAK